MSVVVSYKKQLVLGILLLISLLSVVEVFANIWLYEFYKCGFENNEGFENIDPEILHKLCLESLESKSITQTNPFFDEIINPTSDIADLNTTLIEKNSEGFRGPEFSKEKLENHYRIFMIGGSTVFGWGVLDNETIPYYLQKLYENSDVSYKVEVMNFGVPGISSSDEVHNLKTKLLLFEPDLIIVYEGWNDAYDFFTLNKAKSSPSQWKDRWIEICNLGKQNGFKTIILLQPLINSGNKILTQQEILKIVEQHKRVVDPKLYLQYAEQLDPINEQCDLSVDLRAVFDNVQEPIFYDFAHMGPLGNKITAEKIFDISLPIIIEDLKIIDGQEINQKISRLDSNSTLVSSSINLNYDYLEDFLRDFISPYKTPKIFSLIFSD